MFNAAAESSSSAQVAATTDLTWRTNEQTRYAEWLTALNGFQEIGLLSIKNVMLITIANSTIGSNRFLCNA